MPLALQETPEAAIAQPVVLDPDMQAAIAKWTEASARYPDAMHVSPAEARRISTESRVWLNEGGPKMARTHEARIPDMLGGMNLAVRIYYPSDAPKLPLLVFLHGGGWMICSIDSHDRLARDLAHRSGAAVMSVDYALAPEAKFPAGLRQAAAACRFARTHAVKLGIDPERIAVGGDSAGANLALAATLQLQQTGAPDLVRFLLLFYGVYDSDFETVSYRRYGDGPYLLTATRMRWLWSQYVRRPSEMRDPLAAPLHADLEGIPPCFLGVGNIDILYDENVRMAKALAAAGVQVEAKVYEGLTHAYAQYGALVPAANRAIGDAAKALKAALS
jgi:acetyl esterase